MPESHRQHHTGTIVPWRRFIEITEHGRTTKEKDRGGEPSAGTMRNP
jgi:hypothetical protein